jgi:uncharacterized lipoprotein YajG
MKMLSGMMCLVASFCLLAGCASQPAADTNSKAAVHDYKGERK